MSKYHDPRKETPEHAQQRREAYCKEQGHSWVASVPNGTMRRCSYCGISEIVFIARQEREAAEQAKARLQALPANPFAAS